MLYQRNKRIHVIIDGAAL